jgi:hypothetical protein
MMTTPDAGGTPAHTDLAAPVGVPPGLLGIAGPDVPSPGHPADRKPRRRSRGLTSVGLLLAVVGLFLCYVAASRTVAVSADGASNALQAWSMLHGNWLLHGWWLSDVSFYTTELPEYVLVETVRGLSPDVVHVAAGFTYTLLVLGAAWLAKGRAAGWTAFGRMLLAGGIMLAPLGGGVSVLLLAPDHVGSAVPVLAVLLVLDRAPQRWWVPALTGVVLTGALVADKVVLVTLVLPLLVICAGRVCYGLARRRPLRSLWLEISLVCTAGAAVVLSDGILAVVAAHGGFTVWPVRATLVPWSRVLTHLKVLPRGLALLFGASTTSATALTRGLALLHLAGLGLAVWGVVAALWRFRRLSLVDQLLVTAVLIDLLAFVFLTPGATPYSARDYAAVLPLSAALAGRMAGRRLLSARLAPVTAAVLAGYVLSLATVVTAPSVPASDASLGSWLLAHHLDYGLSGYGSGNTTTLDTGGRVHVVAVVFYRGRFYPLQWEAKRSDYNARLHDATFIVQAWPAAVIRQVFGAPARVYNVNGTNVFVWNENLLTEIRPATSRPNRGTIHHALLPGSL